MRFNNRACALMDIPDLPQNAFEHCGDGKIKPQGGGGGGIPIVSDVVNVVSDVGEFIDKNVTQPIGGALAEADTFVNREIPGGWVTVGLTAAGAAAYTAAANSAVAAGATTAEAAAAGAAAAEAAEAAALLDAAALAEGGVTAGMGAAANTGLPIGTETLGGIVGGAVYPGDAQYIAQDVMEQARATNVPAGSPTSWDTGVKSFITPGMAIQGARLGMGLLGGQQQQPQALPQIGGAMTRLPQGAVDYSGLYNLLALQRARNPNSLLG